VGTGDIAAAISAKGQAVERSEVRLPEGVIRSVGEYEIDVQLHSDVHTTITLAVVAE
jgi:large subunit ribosomal protein L9